MNTPVTVNYKHKVDPVESIDVGGLRIRPYGRGPDDTFKGLEIVWASSDPSVLPVVFAQINKQQLNDLIGALEALRWSMR